MLSFLFLAYNAIHILLLRKNLKIGRASKRMFKEYKCIKIMCNKLILLGILIYESSIFECWMIDDFWNYNYSILQHGFFSLICITLNYNLCVRASLPFLFYCLLTHIIYVGKKICSYFFSFIRISTKKMLL